MTATHARPCGRSWLTWALASAFASVASARAQPAGGPAHPALDSPHPAFKRPAPERYNIKWHDLQARFHASAGVELSDNINLSEHNPESDVSFGPLVGVGFLWPITKANVLNLDLDAGYRWYLHHPSVQTVSIAPDSHLNYRAYLEHGQIDLHSNFSVEVDPTSRPDLGGTNQPDDVINFRRFHNLSGLAAQWNPTRPLSLVAGYDFALDRSLTGEFKSIDRDDHTFNAGTYYEFSPRFIAGLFGSFTATRYCQNIQNDANGYSVGPLLLVQPTDFITIDLQAGYTSTMFDDTGTIVDESDFHGVTGQCTVRHTLNRWISHQFQFSRSQQLGYGNNFYDVLDLQYAVHLRLNRTVSLDGAATYEHLKTSGPTAERADRYRVTLGTSWHPNRHWRLGLSYTFSSKDSNLAERSYDQNRLNFQITRQF